MMRRFIKSATAGWALATLLAGCSSTVDGSALASSAGVGGVTTADTTTAATVNPATTTNSSPAKQSAPPRTSALPKTSAPPKTNSSTLPAQLIGTWESVDSGDVTDMIRFEQPARFKRVEMLTQQRTSGLFTFTVTSVGNVQLSGQDLSLEPTSGSQKLQDPDAPNGGWERPHTLEVERYRWSMTDGRLRLTGRTGTVVYKQV